VSTKPNQGKNPDQDRYGGYTGYQPRKPADDPYGAYYQPSGSQQEGTAGTAGEQKSDPTYVYGQKQQHKSSSASSGQQQQQQQQNSTYQPPSSVSGKRYDSSSKKSTGLEPRYAAVLSYLGLCFTGLFFFLWERKNRLVRFSAAQSIVLFFPLLIIYSILNAIIGFIAGIPIIGLLAPLLATAVFVVIVLPAIIVWLFLMLQAYRGVEVKLPYVGEYAERLLRLFSPRQKKAGN
jgi:uncharacterized membrane protein